MPISNRAIRDTFKTYPKEFAFSNNGITMLCEKQHYDPGQKVLTLDNPRVVNGSQTLHSIRDVPNPSPNARVMVRVIEIEPPSGDALDQKIIQRKEIINKIAVRSNQQNPIKTWDLASNDDFQLELFRLFRGKGLFYERRDREWRQRSRELKSVNIQYGSNIKWLTQLIASYHWSKPRLGPVAAKKVADLFAGEIYEAIRQTEPELVFQIHLFGANLYDCQADLAREKVYIRNLKSYAYFAVFALAVKAFHEVGAKWGEPSFTEHLHGQWQDWWPTYHRLWKDLTKACIDCVFQAFRKESLKYFRQEGEKLTYANYFKNQGYVSRILQSPLSGDIKRHSRAVLRGWGDPMR